MSGLLATAIAEERWDVAALCLVLGVARAARALPPDTVDALVELLAAEPERPSHRAPASPPRRSTRRGRR